MRKLKTFLAQACSVAIVSVALTSQATAATIFWGAAQQIGGSGANKSANDLEISTNGTLFKAVDLANQTGTPVTINGVTFATDPGTFGGQTTGMYNGFGSSATGNTPFGVYLNTPYQLLVSTGIYGGQGSATFTGLTLNHVYQVQIWANDSRAIPVTDAGSVTYSSDNPGVALSTNTSRNATQTSDGGLGQYVIGVFTADSTSFTLSNTPDPSNHTLSAIQIRDLSAVPEPSTTGLLGACFLGLVLFFRRKLFRAAV